MIIALLVLVLDAVSRRSGFLDYSTPPARQAAFRHRAEPDRDHSRQPAHQRMHAEARSS